MIGWLHDDPGYVGGAELTMEEFRAAAPVGVEFGPVAEADTVVVGNCVSLDPEATKALRGKKVIRYHHDLARHEHPTVRAWFERHATHIFTSPLHQRHYDIDGVWPNIPPALDLERLRQAVNGTRKGTCTVASWRNPGKGGQLLREFSDRSGPIYVYGGGPFVPQGPNIVQMGELEAPDVAAVLHRYETFVFLPSVIEPFGRSVVEAWAAGCSVLVNRLVGARHWIEEEPEGLEKAAQRFWEVVCG